jgi:hypothetical protein
MPSPSMKIFMIGHSSSGMKKMEGLDNLDIKKTIYPSH